MFGQDARQNRFTVEAYFRGDSTLLNAYDVNELTHVCYSFLHLSGNRLSIRSRKDSVDILSLTSLKERYPGLKILLSLGGWGGCRTCSEVFGSDSGRSQFAQSALDVLREYRADGLDLDWEYPAVEGYPGHPYSANDRHNFTLLAQKLREVFGTRYEITIAAGATSLCLSQSIEWSAVMPYVDRIHLMTYDFTNGFSRVTGHHTPLYSTPEQHESTDNAVRFLDSVGVPNSKIVIGLAFYARAWANVPDTNNGLYQPGTFLRYVGYKDFGGFFGKDSAFTYHWDSTAQAPFRYSGTNRTFATFDDKNSITMKVRYAVEHHLAGVMFWELSEDTVRNGLLDAIARELHSLNRPARNDQAR